MTLLRFSPSNMDLMTRNHSSQKLGLSNSVEHLPDVCVGTSYRNKYGNLQREKTFSGFIERNLNPVPSRYSAAISPWRPVSYFSTSRVHSPYLEGPLVNTNSESGKLFELEGLKVPAIYSAARNALYQRYTPNDWMRAHDDRLVRSDEACRRAECARYAATNVGMETSDRVQRAQQEVSKKLGERISDIYFLKSQLLEQTDYLVEEMNKLKQSKTILEKAFQETENPLHIAQECLYHREKRQSTDRVHDQPERCLLAEIDVIKGCQKDIIKLMEKATGHLDVCRAVQHELEKDSADKFQALQLDQMAHQLRESSVGIGFHDGIEKLQQRMSVPEKWAEHTAANLKRSQSERAASRKIREDIEHCLNAATNRMRDAWGLSSSAIAQRAQETMEARNQLQVQLTKVNQELFDIESSMEYLKKCITDKQNPLKVTQTRLDLRKRRPNLELCRDEAHDR
ncbi:putative cystoskeletal protein tektin [Fasciola hepatica]|uniref:Tektin n=1 Tax=Fasciola hepatica TaxID=6192 RepID=A0A4E0RCP7_FASHE|nr:putative cystoskeletal protein tektin [Fasciola hepatica]